MHLPGVKLKFRQPTILWLVACLLILAACRDSSTPPTAASQPLPPTSETSLAASTRIRMVADSDTISHLAPLIDLFEQENPEIDVVFVSLEEDGDEDVAEADVMRRLAESGDLFPALIPRGLPADYSLDLKPFIEQDEQFKADDFYPNLLVEDNNALTVIPIHASYQMVYYNRALFDALNVAYPQNGWTVDDFLTTAQKMTLRQGDETVQWGYLPLLPMYSPLLAAQLKAPAGHLDAPRFEDEDVTAGFRWLAALFETHQVTPWLTLYQKYDGLNEFQQLVNTGRVAMWMRTNTSFAEQEALGENLGVVAAPQMGDSLYSEPVIQGYSISRATTEPEAAWNLLRFLSLQPQPNDVYRFTVPARRSLAAATDYWEQLPPDLRDATLYSVENSQPIRLWQEMWETRGVLKAIIEDGQTPEQALAQIAPAEHDDPEPLVMATTQPTPAPSVTAVRFSTFSNTYGVRALADEFNAQNPNLQVTVGGFPDGVEPESYAEYDCYSTVSFTTANGYDHLLPIDTFLELDPTTNINDFYPVTWESVIFDDQRFGLPLSADFKMIVFDRDKLETVGLPDPAVDWSLDQFVKEAQALTQGEGKDKQYGFFEETYGVLGDISVLLRLFDTEFLDKSMSPETFDYAAAAPALRWYADLVTLYGVMPALPVSADDYAELHLGIHYDFATKGNYVMRAMRAWQMPDADEMRERNQGIIPLPIGPTGYSGSQDALMTNFYINRSAAHPQACWQFIAYLSQQLAPVREVPARITVAESTEFKARVTPPVAAMYRTILENQPPLAPLGSRWEENWLVPGWLWLQRARDQAINGEDLLAELALSQAQWDSYRECVIEVEGFEDQSKWIACAVQVDPKQQNWYDRYYTITDPVD